MKREIVERFKLLKNKKFWATLGIDALSFVSISLFAMLTTSFLESIYKKVIIPVNIILLFLYILGLVAIYSFFKYKVLRIISNNAHKVSLKKFYIFNLMTTGVISFVILVIYSLIGYIVRIDYQGIYMLSVLILIAIISYIAINLMQVLKVIGEDPIEVIYVIKNKVSRLLLLLGIELCGLGGLYLIYLVAYYSTNGLIYLNPVFQSAALLFILLYNAINRFLFFNYASSKQN